MNKFSGGGQLPVVETGPQLLDKGIRTEWSRTVYIRLDESLMCHVNPCLVHRKVTTSIGIQEP